MRILRRFKATDSNCASVVRDSNIWKGSLAYRVVAWEPVPHFRAFLQLGVQLNKLEYLIDVRASAVADKAGQMYELVVPQRGIWGLAGVDGMNIDR